MAPRRQAAGRPDLEPRRGGRSSLLLVGAVSAGALLLAPGSRGFAIAGTAAPRVQPTRNLRASSSAVVSAALGGMSSAESKDKLLDLLNDKAVAQEVLRPEGKPTKGRVDEAIVTLERTNPTKEPVYSELVDGTWKVLYSGSYAPGLLSSPTRELALFLYGGGFSLGNALSSFAQGFWGQALGVKLGEKVVKISGGRDVDATVEIEIAGSKRKLSYTAELMPLSAQRMSEEVITLDLPSPLGRQDLPLELRRSILVTYLDDEVMIVRDESGVPDVLVREKSASSPPPASSSTASSSSSSASSSSIKPGGSQADMEGEDPLSSGAS